MLMGLQLEFYSLSCQNLGQMIRNINVFPQEVTELASVPDKCQPSYILPASCTLRLFCTVIMCDTQDPLNHNKVCFLPQCKFRNQKLSLVYKICHSSPILSNLDRIFSEFEYYQIFSEQIHRIFQSNNCIFAFRAVFYAHSSFCPNYALYTGYSTVTV